MSTADDVVRILREEGGYKELPKPLTVGKQTFDFSHALVADDRANDLVVVLEIKSDGREDELVRGVLGLTRALDVLRSKRPVTAVLTTGQPRANTVRTLSQVCRVLPIGTHLGSDPDKATRGWLSVLLPLKPLSAPDESGTWEATLLQALANQKDRPLVDALMIAGRQGRESVKSVFADRIRIALADVVDDEPETFA